MNRDMNPLAAFLLIFIILLNLSYAMNEHGLKIKEAEREMASS